MSSPISMTSCGSADIGATAPVQPATASSPKRDPGRSRARVARPGALSIQLNMSLMIVARRSVGKSAGESGQVAEAVAQAVERKPLRPPHPVAYCAVGSPQNT